MTSPKHLEGNIALVGQLVHSISQADGNPKCVEEVLNPDDNTLFGRKFKSDLRKKARQCQSIFLEVHQISSRNSLLSQVPREHKR